MADLSSGGVCLGLPTIGTFWGFRLTGEQRECINLGSYNYLGFADDWNETCRPSVLATHAAWPPSTCCSFAEGGYNALHRRLEQTVAEFVGKPAAIVFNMGYATNFLGLPALMGKGCLIISDALNHTSIVNGSRCVGRGGGLRIQESH